MDLDNLAESPFLKALDALYERGGDDQYAGLKFDPRGCREYQAILDMVRATLTPPEGYVLVPVEPTEAMIRAYLEVDGRFESARADWAAMLAARPEVQS
jgi:hypothetical protein